MPRLPQPGSDDGTWGDILNDYLAASHTADGGLKAGSVGSAQLQTNAVTATQLAPGAVSATEIGDDTITEAKLVSDVRDKLNATSSGGATNLTTAVAATTVSVESDTGTDAIIQGATTTVAGVMTAADKTKLNSVASGAQVNTVNSVAGRTGAVVLTKGDVGLGNVDNTSDANKPLSTAAQTALSGKADASSLAPVATSGDYGDLTNKPSFGGTNTGDQTLSISGNSLTISGSNGNTVSIPSGGTGGATNLSTSTTATTTTILSDTGTSATIAAATTSAAGVMTASDKTKLNGVATGATANASDSQLRDRATHTGTQAISTVSGLQAALDDKLGEITLADVPSGSVFYVIRSGSNWTYAGTNITNRPTSRTDLVMHLLGGTSADRPAWAITNDIHLADSAG